MTPNRVTDLVAVCLRDSDRAGRYARLLAQGDGWRLSRPHRAWVVATRSLGDGTAPEGMPIVLEGWPDLCRWRGSAGAGHAELSRRAERERWAEVPGDVGAVHVRPDGSAVAARAPAGRVPVYVHEFDDGVVVSTRLDQLLLLRPEWPWRLDGLVLHNWGGYHGVGPPGRTTVDGVRSVPGGHAVRVSYPDVAVSAPERFWDPRPDRIPRRSDPAEYGERLRRLVTDYLRVELDPGGANLLSLSGGVDSSVLAVVTGRLMRTPYSAVSFLPINRIDRNLEEHYLALVAGVAPPGRLVRYAWTPEEEIDWYAKGPPVGLPVVHSVLLTLDDVRRQVGCSVLFGGEWADASSGARVSIADWLAHAPFRDLARHQGRLPVGEKAVLAAIGRRFARRLPLPEQSALPTALPQSAAADVRDEFRHFSDEAQRAFTRDRRPLARLAHELEMDFWLLQNWEVCSAVGVRRITPFWQRGVVELAFGASPTALLGPRTKQPLRRAFADVVPSELLLRKKGMWPNEPSGELASWPHDLPEELASVIRDDWFPRPPAHLPLREIMVLAILSGYAGRLRALRAEARRRETELR